MLVKKRSKYRGQTAILTPRSSQKLFADYPYPILMELNKTFEQPKKSTHLCALVSLQWYKDSFHKLFHVLHDPHGHSSPGPITEQLFQPAHIDESSSSMMTNDLPTQTKPARIKRILATSMTAPLNSQKEEKE